MCDATDLAVRRMSRSARRVLLGLAKNAREGLADSRLIALWTLLLFGGHVLPAAVLGWAAVVGHDLVVPAAAVALSYLPRLDAARRFRQSWRGAALHPLGVLLLLAVQWYATARAVCGRPVGWKGRALPGRAGPTPGVR